jgi:hypothetical protein
LLAVLAVCTSCTDDAPQVIEVSPAPSLTTPPTASGPVAEPVDPEPVPRRPIDRPAEATPAEEAAADPATDPAAKEESPPNEAAKAEAELDEGQVSERNPLAGCELCHVDVEDKFTPSLHFAERVACVDCHGLSEGHVANENNDVKPDVVFDRKNTDPLCEECHACSRPEDSRPAKAPPEGPAICTDCHAHHDLALTTKGG